MEWVSDLSFLPIWPTTIKQYLCHIHSLHINNDLSFKVCKGLQVQWLICGIKKYFGECNHNPVPSVTIEVLHHIMATVCPSSSVEEATFDAVIKMVFSAFLHCGEFMEKLPMSGKAISSMKLTGGDVVLLPDATSLTHACLTIPWSKSDPFPKGVSILIPTAPHAATCAVHTLQYLYSINPQLPYAPLFSGSNGCQLSHTAFLAHLNLSLLAARLSGKYTGHSFRCGTASSAAAAGYSDY